MRPGIGLVATGLVLVALAAAMLWLGDRLVQFGGLVVLVVAAGFVHAAINHDKPS